MQKPRNWRRTGLFTGLALVVAGAGALALGRVDGGAGDLGPQARASTTTAPTVPGEATTTTVPTPGTSPSTSLTATPVPATGDPPAPWRAAPLERSEVPSVFLDAWDRARNRSTCALLVPADAGPDLEGATPGSSDVAGDAGWDIRLRRGGSIVEILGLFETAGSPDEASRMAFSRSWADGSVARYGPDDPGGLGAATDPEASANEAVLTIPGQNCAYRIYDTLGKTHMEFVLEHLRFVAGAP